MTPARTPISNEQCKRPWFFWFLLSFSALLIITIVYYLPLRFEHSAMPEEDHPPDAMQEDHAEEDMHEEAPPQEESGEQDHHDDEEDEAIPHAHEEEMDRTEVGGISKTTRWWILFVGSLVLISILSIGVKKYLQVKPIPKKQSK